jgi:hypothetical protein
VENYYAESLNDYLDPGNFIRRVGTFVDYAIVFVLCRFASVALGAYLPISNKYSKKHATKDRQDVSNILCHDEHHPAFVDYAIVFVLTALQDDVHHGRECWIHLVYPWWRVSCKKIRNDVDLHPSLSERISPSPINIPRNTPPRIDKMHHS